MVTNMKSSWKAEFTRALRNKRYEVSEEGILLVAPKVMLGGVFGVSVDGSDFKHSKNTVTLQWLNSLLDQAVNGGAAATGWYFAPFISNTTPSSALTGANFAATQGEYTGYTQGARQQWISDGASAGQTVQDSAAPATFTIGASATTITGAGLITVPTKGGTTGVCVAASLFDVANGLNPGSTLKLTYALTATPA